MNDYIVFIAIAAIIFDIIVICCFFTLCNNVSKIKGLLTDNNLDNTYFKENFYLLLYLKDKDKAKDYLIENMRKFIKYTRWTNPELSIKGILDIVVSDYKEYLDDIGLSVDETAFQIKKDVTEVE